MTRKITQASIKEKKHTLREVPEGYSVNTFEYRGRPALAQDDFGDDVGLADMIHIDQDGVVESEEYAPDPTNKYYHGGVVQSLDDDSWWVYVEWGTAAYTEQSWIDEVFRQEQEASACGFQFIECADEEEARIIFSMLMKRKNIEKIQEKKIGSTTIWVCKPKKHSQELEDGYLVQQLSSRSRGLPHAYSILDGIKKTKKTSKKTSKSTIETTSEYHPQVIGLAKDLLAETHGHTRELMTSRGLIPTLEFIQQVRLSLLPEVSTLLEKKKKSAKDKALIEELSQNIASMIPRPIPLKGTNAQKAKAIILTPQNIDILEKDLDAFESMIENDLLERKNLSGINEISKFNSDIEWIDPKSALGKWLSNCFKTMNRRNTTTRIVNMFKITRSRCDVRFIEEVKIIAAKNKKKNLVSADAQPSKRPDMSEYTGDMCKNANIILGFHGTPSVNVQPILASNLRMPSYSGLYGAGLYFATDRAKSTGYCRKSPIRNTNFIFIHDVIIGSPYMTLSTGSWRNPPSQSDSIFFHDVRDDDEHIIFNPNYQRIRYLIEFT